MRTIIDIPHTILVPLDQLAEDEGVSRAEIVRAMLADGVKQRKRKKVTLDDAFGICRGTGDFDGLGGLAYQRKIRAEWSDRDREIDVRLGLVKPKKKPKKKK